MANDSPNVRLVRSLYANYRDRDIASFMAKLHPEVEWISYGPRALPFAGRYVGLEGVQQFFGKFGDNIEVKQFAPEEPYLEGADQVFAHGWRHAVARDTGKEFRTRWIHAWRIRGEKVVEHWELQDTAAVRDAFGL